jgi:hypothetical protein
MLVHPLRNRQAPELHLSTGVFASISDRRPSISGSETGCARFLRQNINQANAVGRFGPVAPETRMRPYLRIERGLAWSRICSCVKPGADHYGVRCALWQAGTSGFICIGLG